MNTTAHLVTAGTAAATATTALGASTSSVVTAAAASLNVSPAAWQQAKYNALRAQIEQCCARAVADRLLVPLADQHPLTWGEFGDLMFTLRSQLLAAAAEWAGPAPSLQQAKGALAGVITKALAEDEAETQKKRAKVVS